MVIKGTLITLAILFGLIGWISHDSSSGSYHVPVITNACGG